jgi:hypothetical protein
MTGMKEIVVIVDGTKIEVEGLGFTGGSCEKAIEEVNAALGVVTKRENKAEFYAVETVPAGTVGLSGGGY